MKNPTTVLLIGSLALSGCLALSTIKPRTKGGDDALNAPTWDEPRPRAVAAATQESPDAALSSTALSSTALAAPEIHVSRSELTAEVRRVVASALPFLESEGVAWMDGRVAIQGGEGCVSCHHVPYAVWSHAEARRIGIERGPAMIELQERAVRFVERPDKARAMNLAPMLLGAGHPTETMAARLVDAQQTSGKWRARGQFPSQRRTVDESDAVATGLSLLALQLDEVAAERTEVRRRAVDWLTSTATDQGVEWLAISALVADLTGDREAGNLRRKLYDLQNPDGGWPWAKGEPSNAFSTGQALYALALTAPETNRPESAGEAKGDSTRVPIQRAQRYLIETLHDDGSWHVPSALISEQGNDERDVIYRYWGTAWAVIGLARSL